MATMTKRRLTPAQRAELAKGMAALKKRRNKASRTRTKRRSSSSAPSGGSNMARKRRRRRRSVTRATRVVYRKAARRARRRSGGRKGFGLGGLVPAGVPAQSLGLAAGFLAAQYALDRVPGVPAQLKAGTGRIAGKAIAAVVLGKVARAAGQGRLARPLLVGGMTSAALDVIGLGLQRAGMSGLAGSESVGYAGQYVGPSRQLSYTGGDGVAGTLAAARALGC